jgi:hypothetical protein
MIVFRSVACVVAALVLLGAPQISTAQGPDELWEVTTKMEMVGMPMAMPAQTQKICKRPGASQDTELMPKDRDCKMTDVNRSGNRTTFTMVCEGKDKITGTGDIVSDKDSYQGTMRLKGTMEGRPVDMTQSFSGKRLGACTFEDPKKKHDTMVAQQCDAAIEQMQTVMFTMDGSPCKDRKPEFCSRVSRLAQDMREPQTYRATGQKRSDWPSLMRVCNLDPAAVTKQVCARSLDKRDYAFTAQYCEDDARALAKQQCEGRDYTAAMSSEFAPICRKYAASRGGRSYTAQPRSAGTAPAPPPTPAQQPGATDAIKQGTTDALKKLLPW